MPQPRVLLSEVSQPAKPFRVLVLAVAVLALAFAPSTRATAQSFAVIHTFDSENACDTGGPVEPGTPVFSGILAQGRDGNIYGTTAAGGACGYGEGAVYQMTASGNVSVLHSFGFVGTEGAAADGGLTLA